VVDADLTKYFDSIPHDQLMRSVARRISDAKLLRLIKAWLKAPVEETDQHGGRRLTAGKGSRRGTPQGGVISPLLANIYMNRFLRVFLERGKDREFAARLVAYADDFVILSRGKAQASLAWARRTLAAIGLSLNETKTCIRDARREHFDFLGYSFGPAYGKGGRKYLAAKPSKKAVLRVKENTRKLLWRGNPAPWQEIRCRLNRMLRGWGNYFRYGRYDRAYWTVDQYVYQRTRAFLRRRHKLPTRGTRQFNWTTIHGRLGIVSLRQPSVAAQS
jgi:RNA-directed DNA polymerase